MVTPEYPEVTTSDIDPEAVVGAAEDEPFEDWNDDRDGTSDCV